MAKTGEKRVSRYKLPLFSVIDSCVFEQIGKDLNRMEREWGVLNAVENQKNAVDKLFRLFYIPLQRISRNKFVYLSFARR